LCGWLALENRRGAVSQRICARAGTCRGSPTIITRIPQSRPRTNATLLSTNGFRYLWHVAATLTFELMFDWVPMNRVYCTAHPPTFTLPFVSTTPRDVYLRAFGVRAVRITCFLRDIGNKMIVKRPAHPQAPIQPPSLFPSTANHKAPTKNTTFRRPVPPPIHTPNPPGVHASPHASLPLLPPSHPIRLPQNRPPHCTEANEPPGPCALGPPSAPRPASATGRGPKPQLNLRRTDPHAQLMFLRRLYRNYYFRPQK
jgi:hypothetical protein